MNILEDWGRKRWARGDLSLSLSLEALSFPRVTKWQRKLWRKGRGAPFHRHLFNHFIEKENTENISIGAQILFSSPFYRLLNCCPFHLIFLASTPAWDLALTFSYSGFQPSSDYPRSAFSPFGRKATILTWLHVTQLWASGLHGKTCLVFWALGVQEAVWSTAIRASASFRCPFSQTTSPPPETTWAKHNHSVHGRWQRLLRLSVCYVSWANGSIIGHVI